MTEKSPGKYIRTPEMREAQRQRMLGRKASEETKRKMSESHKGRIGPNKGKIFGANNPNWKGGIKIGTGNKVLIYDPNNHMSDCQGYIRKSRKVMAEHLGRELKSEEVVHHIDGDLTNDSIENLALCKNQSEHLTRYHVRKGEKGYGTYNK